MNSYYFTGNQCVTQKLTDMIVWIALPHLETGLFITQDNYPVLSAEAHLPWPSASPPASPEHKLAIMPCCLALLSSSFLGLPLCSRMNKDRGDCLPVSVFYGGKHKQHSFHIMPQTKHCLVAGRDSTKVSPITTTLIGCQEEHLLLWGSCSQGKSQRQFLDSGISQISSEQGGSSDDQRCSLSSYLGSSLGVNSHAHVSHWRCTPLLCLKICKQIQPRFLLLHGGSSSNLHRSNPCQNFT